MLRKRIAFVITSLLFLLPVPVMATQGVQALQLQRSYPVLIGRETNNIVELKITADEEGIEIRSFRFEFKDTDAIQDIYSLTLFVSGPEGQLETKSKIGTANKPTDVLIFQRNISLKKGDNWFWLSCRLKPSASLLHYVDVTCSHIEPTTGNGAVFLKIKMVSVTRVLSWIRSQARFLCGPFGCMESLVSISGMVTEVKPDMKLGKRPRCF